METNTIETNNNDYSLEKRNELILNAETFCKLGEYSKARDIYSAFESEYPYDYRGYWGYIQMKTKNFTSHIESIELYNSVLEKYKKATVVANDREKALISEMFEEYITKEKAYYENSMNSVTEAWDNLLESIKARVEDENREDRVIEEKYKKSALKLLKICNILGGRKAMLVYSVIVLYKAFNYLIEWGFEFSKIVICAVGVIAAYVFFTKFLRKFLCDTVYENSSPRKNWNLYNNRCSARERKIVDENKENIDRLLDMAKKYGIELKNGIVVEGSFLEIYKKGRI